MVTKGIITSIDFNGNTCQVRIPLFETAGNDPIISTAVVSNTPGSYNGYKVDDVVLVAFEDGKMETPVVIGKLYLGAEKEKADPRGSLNTESLVAAKTAAVPADTKLTTNTDKNLPNTMNPYANLSSIANNLNKLNTDVNYLDVFTNNQFSSVITDVNKQGEELRSEIKQTANNIEAKVDKKHDSTTTSLGWNLTDTKWTIDATNTDWPTNKLTLFEVDRNGQVIINGNVRIGGYPQSRTRFYKKLAADSESPEAPKENITTEELPDEGWYETYEWENNYHIWETIQTIVYDTNDDGELQLKITYSTPVDITGAVGEQGISIKSQIIYYAMVDSDITHVEKPDYVPKDGSNQDNHVYGNSADTNIIDLTAASPVKGYGWSTTPHEYIDGWNYYTSVLTIYSDDDQTVSPAINHRSFADPVKAQELDGVYELAQGKSKNYYSETDPAGMRGDAYGLTMRKGYCWFDTGYTQISTPKAKSGYLGKWLRIQDANGGYVVKSDENPVRLIQWKDGITDQRYNMIKVGPENIDTLISNKTIVVGTTEAFETGNLKQWNGTDWVDISGELVTNKLTANYINAMDIIAKKIKVLDSNNDTLFLADGINGNGEVKIGGFTVDSNRLYIGAPGKNDSIELSSIHNLIAYKSTNERTASSYAFVKIIVNNDTNLTIYIRSDATSYPDDNYMMVSTPNAAPYPDYYTDSRVKAHTHGYQNTGKNLNDYRRVEYYGLKKDDYILVIYKRGEIATDATDAGYFLIPDTPDISVSGVSSQFSFTRDYSLDINGVAGASLKVGSNFSVDYTGAIKSTSGTIGGFKIDSNSISSNKTFSNSRFNLAVKNNEYWYYKTNVPAATTKAYVVARIKFKKAQSRFILYTRTNSFTAEGTEGEYGALKNYVLSVVNSGSVKSLTLPLKLTNKHIVSSTAYRLSTDPTGNDTGNWSKILFNEYTQAIYHDLKQNDCIYVIFVKNEVETAENGAKKQIDGAFLIPQYISDNQEARDAINDVIEVDLKPVNLPGLQETGYTRITADENIFATKANNTATNDPKYHVYNNASSLQLGSKFSAYSDGEIYAKSGQLGPWNITNNRCNFNYFGTGEKNGTKYEEWYKQENAAWWDGDGITLTCKKTTDDSWLQLPGHDKYNQMQNFTATTKISAVNGVTATSFYRLLYNCKDYYTSTRSAKGYELNKDANWRRTSLITSIANDLVTTSKDKDGKIISEDKIVSGLAINAIATFKVRIPETLKAVNTTINTTTTSGWYTISGVDTYNHALDNIKPCFGMRIRSVKQNVTVGSAEYADVVIKEVDSSGVKIWLVKDGNKYIPNVSVYYDKLEKVKPSDTNWYNDEIDVIIFGTAMNVANNQNN